MKWPKTIAGAWTEQERLRRRVSLIPFSGDPEYVAGVDASFSDDAAFAAACVFRLQDLMLIEYTSAVRKISFPYLPGLFSFREGPAIVSAIEKLSLRPDVILIDGQGIAHPRGIGIASHIGVLLNIPTIGCAKTRLVGEFSEPGKRKGSQSGLVYGGTEVGAVLRTRDNVKPIFISPGHLCDIDSAARIVLSCVRKNRIPEPLRCADRLSKQLKQQNVR